MSPVVRPKATGELPDQPEPEQLSLEMRDTKLLLKADGWKTERERER